MQTSQRVEFLGGPADGRQTRVTTGPAGTLPDTLMVAPNGRIMPGEAWAGSGELYRLDPEKSTRDGARIYRRV